MNGATFDDPSMAAELRQLGVRFDPFVLGATRDLYRVPVSRLPWSDRGVIEDQVYGEAPRHRLDIYPADVPNAPVLLFMHGGGFVGGDKRGEPLFYANVGRYFAAHGYLAVLANYRLAPDSVWPSGNEDLGAILRWIGQHARDHGGDPQRIVIIGQSAGAAHVAGYLFDPRWNGRKRPEIRAVALLSGFYRAVEPMLAGPRLYVGEDPAQWSDRSPASHIVADHPPLMLSVAEFDPAEIAGQTLDLASALNVADGRAPELHWFAGHNHVSTVHGLGLGQDSVGVALRNFLSRHLRENKL